MTDKPVGIGLVGAGAYGEFCLAAFAQMPEVKITAVADVNVARAQQLARHYQARAYDSLDALLADAEVEIVALNTPPNLHAPQGLAALHAGKHLFCEKPLALTVSEGEQLIDAAKAQELRLTVDYVMRQNPYWVAAAALKNSGVLGALRHMDLANHAAGLNLPDNHWFWNKALSGGIWVEHGVHFFDACAWVAGTEGEILSAAAYARGDGAIDRVECLARYGETAAHFYHGFDQSSKTEQTTVTLTFERGYITLREWVPTSMEVLTTAARGDWLLLLPDVVDCIDLSDGRTFTRAYSPAGKSALYTRCIQDGMRQLAHAVRDPHAPLLVTGEHGLASLRMAVTATN
ncbi:MAG: Gfo/Idh/MocA family oxidoreductase [Anaerolineae bacterium]